MHIYMYMTRTNNSNTITDRILVVPTSEPKIKHVTIRVFLHEVVYVKNNDLQR